MKPIICFDLEATGPDPAMDRIVQFAARRLPDGYSVDWLINPGRPIPVEVSEIHGITDADVADLPGFEQRAKSIHSFFQGCDLLGFNLSNFDVPLLWEEFHRAGIEWDLSDTRILDAGTLFKRREERTLSAAVQFYCGRAMEDAHNAMADVDATIDVWHAQMQRYELSGADREKLETESNYEEKRVDLAGKIIIGKDGRPTYNIGKVKGTAVEDDPGFGHWMLARDFSQNTKMHLTKILYPEAPSEEEQEPAAAASELF